MNKRRLENKLRMFFYSPRPSNLKELDSLIDKRIGRITGKSNKKTKKHKKD